MVEKEKLLEVSVGLATQIFRFITPEEYVEKLENTGTEDAEFAKQLVEILKRYNYPEIKVPRIRRFVIELVICLMKFQRRYIQFFRNLAADEVLKSVAETTSELESFNVFSGSVGLSRHAITISSLVETALELMGQG